MLARALLPLALVWSLHASAQEGNARAEAIAQASPNAKAALAFIESQIAQLRDPTLRAAVKAMVSNPAPTFMARWPDAAARAKAHAALVKEGLLDPAHTAPDALFPPLADPSKAPQSFLAAPGGGTGGHHSYPGGLAEHTAFNLQSALDLEANYRKRYGITDLDHDLVIAAPILHDLMKAWCLQWKADGTELEQATIANTASHHIFILAEALHRGLSAELVVAVAAAHDPPHLAEEKVAGFLRAAAILAGVDPQQRRLTAHGASIEAEINHLADHDFVISEPIERVVLETLGEIAGPPGMPAAERRWRALEAQSRVSSLAIYAALRARGAPAVRELLRPKP
ncbi:MAG TPA: hypothetical protein VFA20_29955 [Myxococcaceae bacterium]|nr:hypothetical protein [Myxococcaceae bacterium]